MANVHTLADLEEGNSTSSQRPNAAPLPNPWASTPGYSLATGQRVAATPTEAEAGDDDDDRSAMTSGFPNVVQMPGIDGRDTQFTLPQSTWQRGAVLCCGACFPCFIPPLWSAGRKQQYLNLAQSFTFVVSLIQVIMFIVELSMGGVVSPEDNPSFGPSGSTLVKLGAKDPYLMRHDCEIWRFITPIFLHAGFLHILFNLLFQLRFGLIMERKWGTIRYGVLYFIAGVGGNLMSCLIYYDSISVGASTALMGVLGAYCVEMVIRSREEDPTARQHILPTLLMVAFILLFSFLGSTYIDAGGHLGGFIVGVLVGGIYTAGLIQSEMTRKLVASASLLLLTTYFIGGFILFYTVVLPA